MDVAVAFTHLPSGEMSFTVTNGDDHLNESNSGGHVEAQYQSNQYVYYYVYYIWHLQPQNFKEPFNGCLKKILLIIFSFREIYYNY